MCGHIGKSTIRSEKNDRILQFETEPMVEHGIDPSWPNILFWGVRGAFVACEPTRKHSQPPSSKQCKSKQLLQTPVKLQVGEAAVTQKHKANQFSNNVYLSRATFC